MCSLLKQKSQLLNALAKRIISIAKPLRLGHVTRLDVASPLLGDRCASKLIGLRSSNGCESLLNGFGGFVEQVQIDQWNPAISRASQSLSNRRMVLNWLSWGILGRVGTQIVPKQLQLMEMSKREAARTPSRFSVFCTSVSRGEVSGDRNCRHADDYRRCELKPVEHVRSTSGRLDDQCLVHVGSPSLWQSMPGFGCRGQV